MNIHTYLPTIFIVFSVTVVSTMQLVSSILFYKKLTIFILQWTKL